MGDLVAVREQLMPALHTIEPVLEQLLPQTLPPEKLMQTLIVSVANNPALARASRPSLLQAAVSAAVLGVEVDGVSGQGYMLPFKDKAQFIVGYKGMVTIAARSQRTLEGFIVHEGDALEFDELAGEVHWRRELGGEDKRRVVASIAVARSRGLPRMVRVLSLDELLAIRDRSPGWKAKRERSPWGTDFGPMCRKSSMRRLSSDLPVVGLHYASALDTMHELGHHAYLHQDGGMVVNGRDEVDPVEVVREARERGEVGEAQPGAGEILEGEVVEHRTEPGPWTIDWGDGVHRDSKGPARFLEQLERGLDRALAAGDKGRASQVTASCRERVLSMMGTQHDPAVSRVLSLMDSLS